MGLSAIDFLTGILNRRAFQKSVEDEMYKKTPGVFIFIDVDNFKSYNDTYGHNNGDFCLKHFAETMKKCFPAESIIGRYGGDEFVVYLKNLTVEEVQNYMADFQSANRCSCQPAPAEPLSQIRAKISSPCAETPIPRCIT